MRSREELSVTTESVAVSSARLEKFVVTEQRMITVDVTREDVRIVYDSPTRSAIAGSSTPGTQDPDTPATSDTVVLYAEQIEIIRRWVPVETARLDVTTVTTTETVTDTVRVEHIDASIAPTDSSARRGQDR